VCSVRATKQFRVPLDSNHYSVPALYAGQRLLLKAYADRLCIHFRDQLVARHPRACLRQHINAGLEPLVEAPLRPISVVWSRSSPA